MNILTPHCSRYDRSLSVHNSPLNAVLLYQPDGSLQTSSHCSQADNGAEEQRHLHNHCEDPLHGEACRTGLYVAAALSEEGNTLVYIGFTRRTKKGNEMTAFFPLLPPVAVTEKLFASLLKNRNSGGSGGFRRQFYPWPPAEFTLSPKGVIEYNGSVGGRHRYLSCVSRQHAAASLFKVIQPCKLLTVIGSHLVGL